jgi:arylsulfatase A
LRTRIFSLAVLVVALHSLPALAGGAEGRLNVVLILADDLGWADLGCYGSGYYETPNLDRLASRGMRFTNAYAACPVCSPTRASLLTGKAPARLGLTDWIPGLGDRPDQTLLGPPFLRRLPAEELTLAEALKAAGYATCSVGKWHLGGDGSGPTDHGFDLNVAGTERGSPPGYYPQESGTFPLPGLRDEPKPGRYLTDRLTDEALEFLDAHKDEPFFLYLPHFAVHTPIQPRPDLLAKYQARDPGDGPRDNPDYAAMVESLDESVGRVVAKLDELGIDDRTLVIFTSDNGGLATREGPHTPATSNAPLRAGKGYLYEGGIRGPLIVAWPGVVEPGSTSDLPVSSYDLLPTVLEACSAGRRDDPTLDGLSLVPLLKGEGAIAREALYWHYPHYSNQGGTPGGAVRLGNLKLIEFYEDDHVELYDLAADIGETRDLAGVEPKKAEVMRRLLHLWRDSVGAKMPTRK